MSASFLALSCAGCGASTILVQADDAAALDASASPDTPTGDASVAPPDAAVDARRCDPSVLADAGPVPDVAPPDGPYVVDLSLRIGTQCARMSNETLRCRGTNLYGSLGNGTEEPSFDRAVEVPGLTGVEQVVVNDYSACARLRDGTVRCWGDNEYEQLGVGHDGDEVCGPTAHACRRRPTAVPGLTEVVRIASAIFATCAVRRDGSVWCWGRIGFPVLSTPRPAPTPVRMEGLDDVVWLRAGLVEWYVLHRDGRWETLSAPPDRPSIPRGATLAEGPRNSHVCYRLPDTSVRCFGYNYNGKIGNGASATERVTEPWDPGLCGVRDLAMGAYHTCAVTADRRVWCWGDASYDSLGVPASERCVGINAPGPCVTRPTRIEGLDQVDRVFAGTWGNCAIRLDRSVWCWGDAAPMREARPTLTAW